MLEKPLAVNPFLISYDVRIMLNDKPSHAVILAKIAGNKLSVVSLLKKLFIVTEGFDVCKNFEESKTVGLPTTLFNKLTS